MESQDICSKSSGVWSSKEHVLFLDGIKMYGRNWQKVAVFVGSRTPKQTRAHAHKFFEKMEKNVQQREIKLKKDIPKKVDMMTGRSNVTTGIVIKNENHKNDGGRWSSAEHELFLEGCKLYGKDWHKVSELVSTRTLKQTRTHAQKYFEKLGRHQLYEASRNWMKLCISKNNEEENSLNTTKQINIHSSDMLNNNNNHCLSHFTQLNNFESVMNNCKEDCKYLSPVDSSGNPPMSSDRFMSCNSVAELNWSRHGCRYFDESEAEKMTATDLSMQVYEKGPSATLVASLPTHSTNTTSISSVSNSRLNTSLNEFENEFVQTASFDLSYENDHVVETTGIDDQPSHLVQNRCGFISDALNCNACNYTHHYYGDLSFSSDVFLHDQPHEVEVEVEVDGMEVMLN